LFQLDRYGSGFTTLHSFTPTGSQPFANPDGASPNAGLVSSGGALYGTAYFGGMFGKGTVFAINTDGTGFRTLHTFGSTTNSSFTNRDGAFPKGLILSGNTLYGVTFEGGQSGRGTVFKVNTDGSSFTNLHPFSAGDGAAPLAGLILSAGRLCGTTSGGGASGEGTVFTLSIDGSDFRTLHSFTALSPGLRTNADGAVPLGSLVLSGNNLYGTACYGGSGGSGTVFMLNTNGSNFMTLHHFMAFDLSTGVNTEGVFPATGLILSGNTLYGTAQYGGTWGNGTLFALNINGAEFSNLYSFHSIDPNTGTNSSGAFPFGQLTLSGNTLYGTAKYGGSSGLGTIFGFALPPRLTLNLSAAGLVLMWPTNAPGLTLQSSPALVPTANWSPVPAGPVLINGQNVLTNSIDGTQRFFRLH
jgi:uncharacterized repeat protein (TIGR03803 family)